VQQANEQYEEAIENFYKYEREFEEAEKLAVQAGQPTPQHPAGYRDALQVKINAIQQRDYARLKFQEAGGRLDSWGRPLDPAPGATSMVGMAGGAGRK
jgi:hypothetical protein